LAAPKIGGDTSDVQRDFPPSKRRSKDDDNYSRAHRKAPENHAGGASREGEGEGDYSHHHHQEQSHNDMRGQMGNNQGQPLGDFPDIFRGLLTDPFPFAGMPIHTNFDNPIAMQEAPPHFMQQNRDQESLTPNQDNCPDMMQSIQTPHTSMMFPTPEQLQRLSVSAKEEEEEEEAHQQQEKRQRRKQSQGVGQISLPPRFPPHWVPSPPIHPLPRSHSQGSGEPFSMAGLAHSFRDSGHGSQTTRASYEDISSSSGSNNAGQRRVG